MVGGALTLLFTDIQGSTRMLDRLGERYRDRLAEHHREMREAIDAAGGQEVVTAGDSFFAVFARAGDAVSCPYRALRNRRGFAKRRSRGAGGSAPDSTLDTSSK
jgi:class 3 adenylate cyclase